LSGFKRPPHTSSFTNNDLYVYDVQFLEHFMTMRVLPRKHVLTHRPIRAFSTLASANFTFPPTQHHDKAMMSKPSQPYVVDLQFRGHVEGLTYLDEESKPLCRYFGGVPYALPPLGPFRFQKPRSLPTCYRYGTRVNPARFTGSCGLCPQPAPRGTNGENDSEWDEDCLQSNVWVPVGDPPVGGN
jgi:hypothetical protein